MQPITLLSDFPGISSDFTLVDLETAIFEKLLHPWMRLYREDREVPAMVVETVIRNPGADTYIIICGATPVREIERFLRMVEAGGHQKLHAREHTSRKGNE